jgi:hypothetical protein
MAPDADLLQHPHVSSARSQEREAMRRAEAGDTSSKASPRRSQTLACHRRAARFTRRSLPSGNTAIRRGALRMTECARGRHRRPANHASVCATRATRTPSSWRGLTLSTLLRISFDQALDRRRTGSAPAQRHEFAAEGYESQRNSNAKANSVNALLFSVLIQPIFPPTRIQCSDPLANDSTDAAVSCCK